MKEILKKMKEKDLKRAYNNVLSQTISSSQRYLFAGNLFGDIFVLRLVESDSVDLQKLLKNMLFCIYYIHNYSLNELDKNNEEPPGKLQVFPQGSDVDINCLSFHRDFLIVGAVGLIYGLKWDEEEQVLGTKRAWEIKIPMQPDAVEVPDVNSFWICQETDILYAGCGDSVIYQINLEDGRIEREYRGHTDYIHSVVSNSDGRIFSGAEDGTVRTWDDKQKEAISILEPHTNPQLLRPDWGKWIGDVAVNDNWLICGGGPRPAIWHLGSMQCTNVFDFPGRVHICEIVDDSVLLGGEHNHVQFYSLVGELQANIPVEHTASYSSVWQTSPFKFMSIAGFSNKLHILKDFRFLDSKIELYGNLQGEDTDKGKEDEQNDIDDDGW